MRDLILDLDLRGARGHRVALETAVRDAVRGGRLPAGTRLPSSRALAEQLRVARSTVVLAYEQLVVEGYLQARHGSGTMVAPLPTGAGADAPPPPSNPGPSIDLVPGEPDRTLFPRARWLAASRRALDAADDELFGYPERRGRRELRLALASYLGRARAVAADAERVAVFAGMTDAFGFLAEALLGTGVTRIAVEDPSLPPLRRVFSAAGLTTVPVPVDRDGLSVDALAASGVGAVVVTPAHQYPLGITMSPARRAELLGWARHRGGWVIEDDYDGEFRYDRQPVGALQGLDPDRVIYAGTASKSLAAGVRLGWLVVPPRLAGALDRSQGRRGAVSTLEQATLASFIEGGDFDRQIRRARGIYRHRRDQLVDRLAEVAPTMTLSGIAGGLHLTALLPPGRPSEADLIRRAGERGLALFGLGSHWCGEPRAEGLVLGFGRPPAHRFPAALDQLATVLDEQGLDDQVLAQ